MATKEEIDSLKAKIKKAKQENKPYQVIADMEMDLGEMRSQGTIIGAFLKMRRATAKAFYGKENAEGKKVQPVPKDQKKLILEALRQGIKDIEACKVQE